MEMELAAAIVTGVVSVVGALVAVVTVQGQAEKAVGDLYDQMVRFRVEHPEVLELSRKWASGNFAQVYGDGDAVDPRWVTYYSYFELCVGYCNSAILAWYGFRLGRRSFTHHHKPLIKLVLTENYPIMRDLLHGGGEGKYLSVPLKKFMSMVEGEGWDWEREHELLKM